MDMLREVASKIIQAEKHCLNGCDNNIMTAILGKQVPVLCNKLPSLGWISFGKENDQRKWSALTITNAQVAAFHWKLAQTRIKQQFTKAGEAAVIYLLSPDK
ncbi:hypothetical protein CAL7716_066520 [Calothrix sp. PCC 7716]|nr:hypothetical protein CAL7716_066520 [Calothrix sp. PCC 7716]